MSENNLQLPGDLEDGVSTAPVPEPDADQAAARQPWHRPAITRIDIKRTLIGQGSFIDAQGFSFG